jgi:undecaprenyl-diphosphatase
MGALLGFFGGIDAKIYYFLCRAHGNWFLDRMASFQESNTLLKSGVFIAVYWYFWFRQGPGRDKRRASIVTIIGGTLTGLVITRVVATLLPFRVRPLYDPKFLNYPLSFPAPNNFVDWSSFPSDHAAYLGALAFGLIYLSRRLTIPVTGYLAGWICFPRMYLGIHYFSDVVCGAAIGAAAVWAALRIGVNRSRPAQALLAFPDAKPEWFYPTAFLVLYEMSVIFYDLRSAARAVLHFAAISPYGRVILAGSACVIGLALFGLAKSYGVSRTGKEAGFEPDKETLG